MGQGLGLWVRQTVYMLLFCVFKPLEAISILQRLSFRFFWQDYILRGNFSLAEGVDSRPLSIVKMFPAKCLGILPVVNEIFSKNGKRNVVKVVRVIDSGMTNLR